MKACLHFVNQHQGILHLADILGDAQDGAFARGHVQLRVLRAEILFGEEQVLPAARQPDYAGVPERENPMGQRDL